MTDRPPGAVARTKHAHRAAQRWRQALSGLLVLATLGVMALLPVLNAPFETFDYYGRVLSLRAPEVSLEDTEGRTLSLRDLRGKFVYLMFGYLSCDRVCHPQALTLYLLSRRIAVDRVHFIFVGMDPARDTPEKIRHYFDSRAANFRGLVPRDMAQAQEIAARFHAYFSAGPRLGQDGYRIDHPGYIYLIDPSGDVRLVYSGVNLNLERMLDDLIQLQLE